ncbi:hypothetical protein C0993_012673, partial [Termitomyces sp. T159_Od127]
MSNSHNCNPSSNNQHGIKVKKDDPCLVAALKEYHEQLMDSNEEIAQHLARDHGIHLSASFIKHAHSYNSLVGSGKNLRNKGCQEAEQLVLEQLNLDPAGRAGPHTICQCIASRKTECLPHEFVCETMKTHNSEGFERQNPSAWKILCHSKVPLRIHERWSCNGHDKLYKIGFPIYGFVDEATGTWLYAGIAPSNCYNIIIGYLFLCCVEEHGGIPLQLCTDCGSETALPYGLQNALQQ